MIASVRVLCVAASAVACAASPSYDQTDLAAVKQAVRECVALVRQDAIRPENYDPLGQPAMWRKFDAYLSPDGRVHNNAQFVGEQEGVYRFEKCLADHGFSLGFGAGASNNPPKPDINTCTQEEFDFHRGDCWIKLSGWEKQLAFEGFVSGKIYSYDFAKRQQYDRMGSSVLRFLPYYDAGKAIPYFDQLYGVQENRTIWWSDALDLLFRTQANPNTKDIPGLIALYQKHEKPLFSGYLRKFVPPNKVVISEFSDRFRDPEGHNQTVTITLLDVSAEGNSKAVTEFMTALLNVKQCNTLIRKTDGYKYYAYLKTDVAGVDPAQQKQRGKDLDEIGFYPELKVVIQYPEGGYGYQQEEFFNGKSELSGIVLLDKGQEVCLQKKMVTNTGTVGRLAEDGKYIVGVKLGELMIEGAKNQNEYSANYFRSGDDFINLNKYLIANGLRTVCLTENGLRTVCHDEDDPRPVLHYFGLADPAPDGVKKILTVGAAQ